jgi:hypothetical protein
VPERALEPLGDRTDVRCGAVVQQDGEFVAADARQQVAASQLLLPDLRGARQQPVAGVVAERVIGRARAILNRRIQAREDLRER